MAAPYTLGDVYMGGDGRLYRYFKLADLVNGTNGMVAEWATPLGTPTASPSGTYNVTVDRAGGSSVGRVPACVLVCAVTHGNYFFGLVKGYHAAIKDAAGGVNAVNKKCMPHATTDGDAAPATAYTDSQFAVCLVVSAGGVFGGEVNI